MLSFHQEVLSSPPSLSRGGLLGTCVPPIILDQWHSLSPPS